MDSFNVTSCHTVYDDYKRRLAVTWRE